MYYVGISTDREQAQVTSLAKAMLTLAQSLTQHAEMLSWLPSPSSYSMAQLVDDDIFKLAALNGDVCKLVGLDPSTSTEEV